MVMDGYAVKKKGRPPKSEKRKSVLEEIIAHDPTFQKDMVEKAKDAFALVYSYLTDLVEGRGEGEERMSAKGDIVTVKPSHDVRVKAAKVLKELTIDKVVADKRDSGNEKGRDAGIDLREALMEIEKQRQKAKKEGKLADIREARGG